MSNCSDDSSRHVLRPYREEAHFSVKRRSRSDPREGADRQVALLLGEFGRARAKCRPHGIAHLVPGAAGHRTRGRGRPRLTTTSGVKVDTDGPVDAAGPGVGNLVPASEAEFPAG